MTTDQPTGEPTGLTPALELLWGLRERPRRGPKPGLSLERIVAAAIDIADVEGIGAVSMGRVAGDLGFSTMSLYRYVATKDDLLVLMASAAVDDPPDLVPATGDDWRAGLALWTRANLEYLVRRPWIMQVAITGPPIAPKQLAWMESALAVLARTPLLPAEQIGVLQLLLVYALGEARLAVDLMAAAQAGTAPVEYGRMLDRLTDAERHPALRALVADGVFDAGTDYGDEDVAFGLDRVLDGVGLLIEARGGATSRR